MSATWTLFDDGGRRLEVLVGAPPIRNLRGSIAWAPIPQEFLPSIGQIATIWAQFEASFMQMLKAMVVANGTQNDPWERIFFDKKLTRFRAEADCAFRYYPLIAIHLKRITSWAEFLQPRRNLIVHGKIDLRVIVKHDDPAMEPEATLYLQISGRDTKAKRDIVQLFSLSELEDLASDLAHLNGAICDFHYPNPQVPGLAWQDKLALLDFLRTNHQGHHSMPATT
ncbi:hypothetical protein [Bradyrhizobium sp. SEMIA]|uniref:hypothetical protein n=1 Tax=Bradyrhizobium sp. SEMIA TaxID=2597515 RepID=UPI0018A48B83|nr:hypothetical protein [Bradyrhizobium sp. SEMIA]QOG17769.1 hypothetical protein FOM02_10855 [Bradyrhizobium sp. SEMIA]